VGKIKILWYKKHMDKKYQIIFDSNILWQDTDLDKIFNSNITDLKKFVEDNNLGKNIEILIPEIVIKERISQNLRGIEKIIKNTDEVFEKLKLFGVENTDNNYKNTDYESFLNKKAEEFLAKNKITTIKISERTQEEVLKRAYKKLKPFSSKENSDKGYKDTMIWLSILDNAKENQKVNHIICTNNKEDFSQEILAKEFKENGKDGELLILDTIQAVKEYLDNKLNLRLDLKELYRQIENEIKEKMGTILVAVNSYKEVIGGGGTVADSLVVSSIRPYYADMRNIDNVVLSGTRASVYGSYYGNENNQEKIGYDFKNIKITNINEESENNYSIKANLMVNTKYKNNNPYQGMSTVTAYSIYGNTSNNYVEREETISIELFYNRNTRDVRLIYMN